MNHPSPAQLFDVAGRVALVTGSSKGIGYGLSRGLLEADATVILNGRDVDAVNAAVDELAEDTGRRPHAAPFDVTDTAAVTTVIADIENRIGPLDIVVNNVGSQHRTPLPDFDEDDWERLLAQNLTSAFLVCKHASRRMTKRERGKIVNICSLQSEVVRPGIAPYSATKGGLKQLTKGMCADLAPHGIQVNGIGPGYFDTELNSALVADEEFTDWIRRRTPAGRWGRVDDLTGALLFLCSDASAFVNGQVLYVDGGMLSTL